MRTETTTRTLYTAEELQELHPDGFDVALHEYASLLYAEEHEVYDSLRAIWDAADYMPRDTRWPGEMDGNVDDLTGKRALAWFERTLQAPYRVPWAPITGTSINSRKRREAARWKYRPGTVRPCPFTGVCFDDDLLHDLKADLVGGMSVIDALRALEPNADWWRERDIEGQCEPETFIETADANGWEFTERGGLV